MTEDGILVDGSREGVSEVDTDTTEQQQSGGRQEGGGGSHTPTREEKKAIEKAMDKAILDEINESVAEGIHHDEEHVDGEQRGSYEPGSLERASFISGSFEVIDDDEEAI